jgi:hypothetical protein
VREKYCWLIAGGWFVLREKYCWLVADKPNEHADGRGLAQHATRATQRRGGARGRGASGDGARVPVVDGGGRRPRGDGGGSSTGGYKVVRQFRLYLSIFSPTRPDPTRIRPAYDLTGRVWTEICKPVEKFWPESSQNAVFSYFALQNMRATRPSPSLARA